MKKIKQYINYALYLLKTRGLKYTYNMFVFHSLYRQNSFLRKLFLIKLFPWTVPYPPFIEVETTTRCNLKCLICEHTYWKEPQKDMSYEQFKYILDQFPRLKWIGMTGIGESFLNKDFTKILELVKSREIYIELFDTFYFMNEKNINKLIDLKVDKLCLSIDGATKETYEKIRVHSNFERVVNNISNFVKIKKQRKAYFPELEVHFIANKINYKEIPDFVRFARKIGIDGVVRFTSLLHAFKEVKQYEMEIPESIVKEANKIAEELGIDVAWNKNVPPKHKRAPITDCTVWIMPFIFVTGHVIPCCTANEANRRDFQKKYSIGNIFEKPFKDIWNSKSFRKFRKDVHEGKTPVQCKGCPAFNCP